MRAKFRQILGKPSPQETSVTVPTKNVPAKPYVNPVLQEFDRDPEDVQASYKAPSPVEQKDENIVNIAKIDELIENFDSLQSETAKIEAEKYVEQFTEKMLATEASSLCSRELERVTSSIEKLKTFSKQLKSETNLLDRYAQTAGIKLKGEAANKIVETFSKIEKTNHLIQIEIERLTNIQEYLKTVQVHAQNYMYAGAKLNREDMQRSFQKHFASDKELFIKCTLFFTKEARLRSQDLPKRVISLFDRAFTTSRVQICLDLLAMASELKELRAIYQEINDLVTKNRGSLGPNYSLAKMIEFDLRNIITETQTIIKLANILLVEPELKSRNFASGLAQLKAEARLHDLNSYSDLYLECINKIAAGISSGIECLNQRKAKATLDISEKAQIDTILQQAELGMQFTQQEKKRVALATTYNNAKTELNAYVYKKIGFSDSNENPLIDKNDPQYKVIRGNMARARANYEGFVTSTLMAEKGIGLTMHVVSGAPPSVRQAASPGRSEAAFFPSVSGPQTNTAAAPKEEKEALGPN